LPGDWKCSYVFICASKEYKIILVMEKKVKRSRLAGVPAWALSVLAFVATIIYVFILQDLGMKRELAGQDNLTVGPYKLKEILDFIIFLIIIPITCFFICRIHPKSVWYTPVIANAVGFGLGCIIIIDSIFDPDITITILEMIIWGGSWVLSVTGAIIGARTGRRKIYPA